MLNTDHPLVYTIKGRCRVCYTCVRECPVKAIKIINGQAEVITERCIACGNCVKVCSQGAKTYIKNSSDVNELLKSKDKVVALVAPSYVAEFIEHENAGTLVGMLRRLGFDYVCEVAFGADLVAAQYKQLVQSDSMSRLISSDCPAIVNYIQKYHPSIVKDLATLDSPLMAMHKVVKKKYGDDVKTVFLSPCVAKKTESELIDVILTFTELRGMFAERGINHEKCKPSVFDPPHGGKGAIFPVSHGLLHNMQLSDDITENQVIVAQGQGYFRDVIEEHEKGMLDARYFELLCCDGCIMGPGMSQNAKRFFRRDRVGKATKEKLKHLDVEQWKKDMELYSNMDFERSFIIDDHNIQGVSEDAITAVLVSMNKTEEIDLLNCGACGYESCRDHAKAIVCGLAEEEMCLPFTIEKLNNSNTELANTKQALKQSEKLANMGQLSAGIAHELNNPLGVITMYSNILKDETPTDSPLQEDLSLIVEQANRCKNIVGGLLNFARKSQVNLVATQIEDFVKKSFESIIKPDNVKVELVSNLVNKTIDIDPDQMMQVLTNLEKNAVEAMPDGGILRVDLNESETQIIIKVSDTGTGISPENMDKIYTPFFTTKPVGKGTGLGLPLIYGIIKMHKGQIQVHSNDDPSQGQTGTAFTINFNKRISDLKNTLIK
jgi:iron only hydrogenase large subunit-like protein/nitrogen-specific signal transduction histidine kinase